LPPGVHGLIAARLDTLGSARKRLLQDAAVVGEVFWAGAVTAMGDQDQEQVQAVLHELARKELVRPVRRSSMAGQAEYSFAHALIRDVCYAQIPRAAVATSRYSMLLHRLGDRRYPDAADTALRTLEPLGPSPELAEALADRAAASFLSGQHAEAAALAERAVELAAELGLPVPARALGFHGCARFALGRAAGLDDIRRALEAATAQGLGREAAVLYYNLGASLVRAQGPRAAWELAQQGTAFAQRHGIAEWVPLLEGTAVEAMADLGLIEQARTLMATALSHVAAEDWMGQVDLRCAEARIQARRGELSHSGLMDWIQQTVAKARELGEPQYLGGLLALAAIAWTAVGEARTAAPLLTELEQVPNVRHTLDYLRSLPDLVRVAIAAGEPDLGARLADGLEPVYQLDQNAAVTARALLAEQHGKQAEAEALLAEAAGRWERFEVPWEQAQALLEQGRCLLALGRPTQARESLHAARDIFASLGANPVLTAANRLLAQATALTA
jgi:hypothetical protein